MKSREEPDDNRRRDLGGVEGNAAAAPEVLSDAGLGKPRWQRHRSGARFLVAALEATMLTYFEVPPRTVFPQHSHPGEQLTLVLSGRLVFRVDGVELTVGPGEVMALPASVPHAVHSLDEPVTAVDAWSAPFPDFDDPVETD
ncbi:MAG: cupin domain-containing protein [Acidobacteriota bacterium]